jgi:mitogen-activated protein kinase kinase
MSSIRKKRNFKGLGLSGGSDGVAEPSLVAAPDGSLMRKAPPPALSTSSSRAPSYSHDSANSTPNAQRNLHATLSTTLANLDLSKRKRFDLKHDELKNIEELGMGNGGSVMKVEHVASGTVMAKKVCTQPT